MPTYDYRCDACGHRWELEQRMIEDAVKKCPKCGKLKAKREITGGNFILKGGGWYADLYSSSGGSKAAKSESSDSSSTASTASTASETKTESKPAESKPAASKPEKKSSKKAASKD